MRVIQKEGETREDRCQQFFNAIVRPRYITLSVFLVFIIAALIAYKPLMDFHPLERSIPISPVTPEKIAQWNMVPPQVVVGLHIISFPEFDFVGNKFVFDAVIWFYFNPVFIPLDTISKFSFEKGEILGKSEAYTQILFQGLLARYNIRVKFTTNLEYLRFPFDDHTIYFTLVNRTVQPGEMIFISYTPFFNLSDHIFFSGWDFYGTSLKTGYSETMQKIAKTYGINIDAYTHPMIIYSIDFRREGIRDVLLIILPLFLIYFLSLFCFSFDPSKQSNTILALASAGVTSLLAYRFVIEGMTPKVGYFVLSDYMFILFLAVSLIEFIYAMTVVRIGKLSKWSSMIRAFLFIFINVMVIATWYYLIYFEFN